MEQNSLFPFKYRLRKTDEQVDVVAWETAEKGARSESDWVSYIDSAGVEHIKEHLTLEWDFVIQTPFEKGFLDAMTPDYLKYDPWEGRRYELVKEYVLKGKTVEYAVAVADEIIAALKKSPEAEEEYDNIGVGEIVSAVDNYEPVLKFAFTDRKDIVGYKGDSGRWGLGDKVKVYIKKYEPKKGLD